MKLDQFQKTDFYTFFNLNQVGYSMLNPNYIQYKFKTGGFQEYIDLYLICDDSKNIVKANLFLDRVWIGDLMHLNHFASDITKSFIDVLFPEVENSDLKQSLVFFLFETKGLKDKRITTKNHMKEYENYTFSDDVLNYIQVFSNSKRDYKIKNGDWSLEMKNMMEEKKERLLISIEKSDLT